MEIRQLRYFVAVAEEKSFTKAAKRCNISQPPLSRAISLLESEIGAKLLERDTHSVALTPAGASLVTDARRALATLAEGGQRARQMAMGLRGRLRIGFGGSTVYSLIPSLVRRFRAALPDVEMTFHTMAVLQQIDALRDNEIDVGIVRLPIYDEMIRTKLVHRESLVVALSEDDPLGANADIDLAELATRNFVTYAPRRGFNFQADLLALCRFAGFEPRIVHETGSTESLIGIVACGEGIAIVPASAMRLQMQGVMFRSLAPDRLPDQLQMVDFALAWHRDRSGGTTGEFVRLAPGLSQIAE